MSREKYNLIQELQKKSEELVGKKKLALVGQGDFTGGNNMMRSTMNIKHYAQHLTIDNPEFPFLYDGKENVSGEYSSFYTKTKKNYVVFAICKKYEELLHGKCNVALYFLHCEEDDSYIVVERKAVENLTENFGFEYKNDVIDQLEVGNRIDKGTMLCSSTSYDDNENVGIGVNGRILYAVHPAVQDDAIVISESFAKKMICNTVSLKTIPIGNNTILLNLYGDENNHQGLPNIGDKISNGILCATRTVREVRMFSDLRDISLQTINNQADQIYYGEGEVIDIDVYVNNPNLISNKVTKQLVQYYNDAKWFYTKVYKVCNQIIKNATGKVSSEIHRWKRKAMNYLDTNALWASNDNVFSNIMVEILMRKKEQLNVGRKIVGRSGNKTVISSILKDSEMPFLTTDYYKDEYGVVHPKGPREIVDLITNPLAIINRTIPMVMFEGSVTFILDITRKHAATLDNYDEKKDFIFDILRILNPKQTKDLEDIYNSLSDKKKKKFIDNCISLDENGLLRTDNGLYCRWEPFNEEWKLRDSILKIYEKYPDIFKPYHIFSPKPNWGRDIYIGDDYVGYQYIMMLKQSGNSGFSVRSSGSINEESLPEKNNNNKTSRYHCSTKPIKFGEYESPGDNWDLSFNCSGTSL